MSVMIRLRRMGKKKQPSYRIAVVDKRRKRDGRFIEFIGRYNPRLNPPEVLLQEDKVLEWLGRGADMSETVESIFRKQGLLQKWHEMRTGSEKKSAEEPKKQEAAAAPAATEEPAIEEQAGEDKKDE